MRVKRKNSLWKQVCIFFVLMSVIAGCYMLLNERINRIFELKKDDFSWMFQVDSIQEENGNLLLSGWAFKLDKDAQFEDYEIILYDAGEDKGYYPKMEYISREDVNGYFLCEYDYTESGFIASISKKKLDLENQVYEILVRPAGSKKAFQTNIFYANGKLSFTNPREFVPPEVQGTDLEAIIENGILRVYRPDFGAYVYQYNGELYWIVSHDYGFTDGDVYVQFQMDTTQIEKLPKERLDNKWYWSNLGFYFRENEITEWKTDKYRVTKAQLPTDYSVTKIWTGRHSKDGWVWLHDFRPWYDFDKE